jgi:hypothetical protein
MTERSTLVADPINIDTLPARRSIQNLRNGELAEILLEVSEDADNDPRWAIIPMPIPGKPALSLRVRLT